MGCVTAMVRSASWLCATAALLAACGSDLGHCDPVSAGEIVYNRSGQAATKGQALTQDSCGNGAFCHASAAKGKARYGAPATLDFDMLPSPTGIHKLRSVDEDSWDLVRDGNMPPSGTAGKVVGDGEWLLSATRAPGSPRLPPLSSRAGLAIYRNWLACGAPVVKDGNEGVQGGFTAAGPTPTWTEIHTQILVPQCATAGCHNTQTAAGGLALEDRCASSKTLLERGTCGKYGIVPGSADGSFLLEKIASRTPSCGGAMPPSAALPDALVAAVRTYIEAGAEVDACP
jgi:Planctomycete cytochrome C